MPARATSLGTDRGSAAAEPFRSAAADLQGGVSPIDITHHHRGRGALRLRQSQRPARTLSRRAALGLLGTVAQALLIRAFCLAEAAAVAPFGYTGLIWAGLWGWLFFGAVPDALTFVGAGIVVAAGLYVWAREARLMRRA